MGTGLSLVSIPTDPPAPEVVPHGVGASAKQEKEGPLAGCTPRLGRGPSHCPHATLQTTILIHSPQRLSPPGLTRQESNIGPPHCPLQGSLTQPLLLPRPPQDSTAPLLQPSPGAGTAGAVLLILWEASGTAPQRQHPTAGPLLHLFLPWLLESSSAVHEAAFG